MIKKLYTILAAITIFSFVASAQEPAITMTTTIKGRPLTLRINGTAGSSVKIDFGTGGMVTDLLLGENVNKDITSPSNLTATSTVVKIYGTNITGFRPYDIQVTALDLTKCTGLTYLDARSNQLTTLDVSKNIALKALLFNDNLITTLDVSNNPALNYLYFNNNKLTNIDISNNPVLYYLQCSNNNLAFGTLPQRKSAYLTYLYAPQAVFTMPKTNYSTLEEVDLSSELIIKDINGIDQTTTYTWKKASGIVLSAGTDYTGSNGQFSFQNWINEPIYCEMTNAAFPGLLITTSQINVDISIPIASMTTTMQGETISLSIKGKAGNSATVDFGSAGRVTLPMEGNTTEIVFTSPIMLNRASTLLRIFGDGIVAINVNSIKLKTIDVTGATGLTALDCSNNELTSLNVSNNSLLTELSCQQNNLTFATLTQPNSSCSSFTYFPQKKIEIPSSHILITPVNLSNQIAAKDNNNISQPTTYTWKKASGGTLIAGSDFTENGGIFTFNAPTTEPIFCEMVNPAYPNITLTTSETKIMPAIPVISITTTKRNSTFSLKLGGSAGSAIIVDFGSGGTVSKNFLTDNSLVEFTSPSNLTTLTTEVKVYGSEIRILDMKEQQLSLLDVSKCPSLTILRCTGDSNFSLLPALDVSKNLALKELACTGNKIATLDVSNNTQLEYLYCGNNKISSLDVSKLSSLIEFSCAVNTITNLDVSQNLALKALWCNANKIKNIDLSQNVKLEILNCSNNTDIVTSTVSSGYSYGQTCQGNELTTLDLSKNPLISELECMGNMFSFGKLPQQKNTYTTYDYAPQAAIKLAKDSYKVGESIDLSSQLKAIDVNGVEKTTTYTWKNDVGTVLIEGTDYSMNGGVFTFNEPHWAIFCEMTNPAFPKLSAANAMKTSIISILDNNGTLILPDPAITLTTSIKDRTFSTYLGGKLGNMVTVDFGNGERLTNTLLGEVGYREFKSTTNLTANISEVKFYGKDITSIYLWADYIYLLDVSRAVKLKVLNCYYNKLTNLDISKNTELNTLNCPDNAITALNVTNNTLLSTLDCSENKLTALDVSKNSELTDLNCSTNLLTSLTLSESASYTTLDCSNNRLDFTSLPTPNTKLASYTYAPQAAIQLTKSTVPMYDILDLSHYAIVLDGLGTNQHTSYIWKTNTGKTLVAGTDYTEAGGKFIFLKVMTEPVFCEMKNPTFPDLTLSTSKITVTLPVPVITMTTASTGSPFTISLSGTAGSYVMVDFGAGGTVTKQLSGESSSIDFTSPNNLTNTSTEVKVYGNGILYFNGNSKQLTSLDVSNSMSLQRLMCANNKLTNLDVSSNVSLTRLDCSWNQLTTLDLSKNTLLTYLDCNLNSLTSLDINTNTALENLNLNSNQISTLSVSNNKSLISLDCSNNQLSALDVSMNSALANFYCNANMFTIATLSQRSGTYTNYTYSPQGNIDLPKTSYSALEEVDLSSQLNAKDISGVNQQTAYTWKTESGSPLVLGTDYTETGGKFTFLKVMTEPVFCEMKNPAFPDLTLSTSKITVTLPVPVITMNTASTGSPFTITLSGTAGSTVMVDFGAGGSVTKQLLGESSYIDVTSPNNLTETTTEVKVYGSDILYFNGNSKELTSLDVSKSISLQRLLCANNKLTNLDVSSNSALTRMDCSWNQLTTLDLSKNTLLTYLDCNLNKLTSLNISNCSSLSELICNWNQLTAIDISKCVALKLLDCGNNQLSQLDVKLNTELTSLYCDLNKLTFVTLPQRSNSYNNYSYLNQVEMTLAQSNYYSLDVIDLSSQLTAQDINGASQQTTYTWKTDTGTPLVAGTDYTETGGKFTFLKAMADPIFCEMTNPAFPDLILSTSMITVTLPVPVITMTTTSTGSPFTIKLSGTAGSNVMIDFGAGGSVTKQLLGESSYIDFTSPNNLTNASTEVKVYGSGITRLDAGSRKLTALDVCRNTALTNLDCNQNQLTTLDVRQNTALIHLYCYQNQLATLDVSQNTALNYLNCYYNQLTTLDVRQNTALTDLNCARNQLTTLDVPQNTALTSLCCAQNQLATLDVRQNTSLKDLYCDQNQLATLDVSQNTALTCLSCYYNQLATLDVSQNTALKYLDCYKNQLTTLDVSQNIGLTQLLCYNNRLTFSTLPQARSAYSAYQYAQQKPLSLPMSAYSILDDVDLSSQLKAKDVNGVEQTTTFTWKTVSYVTLVAGIDYTESNGVFTFNKAFSDSLHCEMNNPAFPDLTLKTSNIKIVIPEPSITMTTKVTGSPMTIYIAGESGKHATVDFGEGGSVTLSTTGVGNKIAFTSPSALTAALTTIKVFGSTITDLSATLKKLTALDVSKCPTLVSLACSANELTALDLSNNLLLENINCAQNKLEALTVGQNVKLELLNCYSNKLTTLDVTGNTALKNLYCDYNRIEALDVSNNTMLNTLRCNSNQLNTLDVSKNNSLYSLDCHSNNLNFATLPQVSSNYTDYDYTYQSYLALPTKALAMGEPMDLSSQLKAKDVNGAEQTTIFTWKTANNVTLIVGEDYSEANGIFTFNKAFSDSLRCEMVNQAFPLITNSIPLTTKNIKVYMPEPSITMTTKATGSPMTIYIAGESGKYVTVDFGEGGSVTRTTTGAGNRIAFTSPSALTASSTDIKVHSSAITDLSVDLKKLTALEVSKCPTLISLACSANELTSLDLSNNLSLESISCSQNKLEALTVGQNAKLEMLKCYSNKLTTLDVTGNTALKYLHCDYNRIAALDVSNNIKLNTLQCNNNQLNTLDVSKNNSLYSLDCHSNNLNFATLPQVSSSYTDYDYTYQSYLALPTKALAMGESIDLSSQLKAKDVNGAEQTTTFTWKTENNVTLVVGEDYSEANGIFTFNKAFSDSLRCEMVNPAFPLITNSIPLTTKNVKVYMPEPSITMTTSAKDATVTILLQGVAGTPVTIDFGAAGKVTKKLEGTAWYTTFTSPANLTTNATEIKVYGDKIVTLSIEQALITALDVTNNPALLKLQCANNQLSSLDLSKNNVLTELNCSNNQLISLEVSNNLAIKTLYCYNNKLASLNVSMLTLLDRLVCSNNQLTTLDLSNNFALTQLSSKNNQLTSIKLGNLTVLEDVDVSNNKLSTLDVTQNTGLIALNCELNKLTSLDLSKNSELGAIYCNNNMLSTLDLSANSKLDMAIFWHNYIPIASLPQLKSSWMQKRYAPQAAMKLSKTGFSNGEAIDLSSQLYATDMGGVTQTTTYSWYTKAGVALVSGTDYTESGGITTFITTPRDSIYCRLSNTAYPEFDLFSDNWFVTEKIKINAPNGIDDSNVNQIIVYISEGNVVIDRLLGGETIQVVDVSGRVIAQKRAENSKELIPLPIQGLYVVRVNQHSAKVAW